MSRYWDHMRWSAGRGQSRRASQTGASRQAQSSGRFLSARSGDTEQLGTSCSAAGGLEEGHDDLEFIYSVPDDAQRQRYPHGYSRVCTRRRLFAIQLRSPANSELQHFSIYADAQPRTYCVIGHSAGIKSTGRYQADPKLDKIILQLSVDECSSDSSLGMNASTGRSES